MIQVTYTENGDVMLTKATADGPKQVTPAQAVTIVTGAPRGNTAQRRLTKRNVAYDLDPAQTEGTKAMVKFGNIETSGGWHSIVVGAGGRTWRLSWRTQRSVCCDDGPIVVADGRGIPVYAEQTGQGVEWRPCHRQCGTCGQVFEPRFRAEKL